MVRCKVVAGATFAFRNRRGVGLDVRIRPVPAAPDVLTMWRTEYRLLRADRDVFEASPMDHCFTTSLALGF